MATVVVTFPDPPVSGSTVRAAWVIHASVFTGEISDTALTMVVLPTPNPPATTILAEASRGALAGELVKPIDDSLQERSEEHTSELQSRENLVCRLLLEKKNKLNPPR